MFVSFLSFLLTQNDFQLKEKSINQMSKWKKKISLIVDQIWIVDGSNGVNLNVSNFDIDHAQ